MLYIDHREKRSGIPALLEKRGIPIGFKKLDAGDYQLNNILLIERKSKTDFVRSILDNSLFPQCGKLKNSGYSSLMIIEGNPYLSGSEISKPAIKGTLLSITTNWQIPIFYSSGKEDTAVTIERLIHQFHNNAAGFLKRRSKPKRYRNKQVFFVEGLPGISHILARKLLHEFKTISELVHANVEELVIVNGIGKTRANNIYNFLHRKFTE